MKKVSMKDIAEMFGVSTVTVSKALGNKEGVSEALRSEIKKKAAELGYHQTTLSKPHGIGVLVPERYFGANAFYSRFYSEVSICASDTGAFTILEIVSPSDEKKLTAPKLLNMAEGIVFLGQFSDEYIASIAKSGKPYVLLDFYSENSSCPSVIGDNCFDSYLMTKYLIQRGHKKIGFLGSIFETKSILDRYLGYHRALAEYSLEQRNEWVLPDRKNGILSDSFALPDDMPHAFVCNCDDSASRLIEQLKNIGLRVPEDVSVVGFDDSAFAVSCEPKLTTCRVDTRKMSTFAVETLMWTLNGGKMFTGRYLVHGSIIERDSVMER